MTVTLHRVNDLARNDADTRRVAELQTRMDRVAADFLAFVDPFDDIAPEPVPHVHLPHDDTARRCRVLGPLTFLASWAVGYQLSGPDGTSASWLAFWTLVAVTVADAVGQAVLTAMPVVAFIKRFPKMLGACVVAFAVSASVVLLGRIASPALADLLIDIVPAAWWVLEVSLVALAALGFVGGRHFGTTSRLTALHDLLAADLARLERRIQQRSAPVFSMSAVNRTSMLMLGIWALSAGLAQAQTLALDRTGSVADRAKTEEAVVRAIADHAGDLGRIDILLLGGRPLATPKTTVTWGDSRATHMVFGPLVEAHHRRQSEALQARLARALEVRVPEPPCSSMPGFLARLVLDRAPALLVTDGKDDCGHPSHLPSDDGGHLFIVLTSAVGDPTDDVATFEARRDQLLRLVPRATVVPLAVLDEAVAAWAAASTRPPVGVSRVGRRW